MAGIPEIFNIGRSALFSNQKALQVTSQNIANVSTPGYSRQEAVFSATNPINGQPGQIGTGVEIGEIRRVVDRFVEDQLISGESALGRLQTEEGILRRIESVFSDSQGTGLNRAFNEFFAALNDVSNNPQDHSARVALLEQAEVFVQRLRITDRQFQTIRTDVNKETIAVINEINVIVPKIGELNVQIKQAEFSGQHANDLRDERQLLLNDLAKKIDIKTIEDAFGQTTVFVGSGKTLVEGNVTASLSALADADNDGFVTVLFDPGTGATSDLTSSITDGRLKGLIDIRDQILPGFINTLDRLVGGTINELNQQHRVGFGLDGTTGNNFFGPLNPSASGLTANTGTAVVGVTVSNAAALSLNPYVLSFTGGNYTLSNSTTGASTTGAYADPTTVTFEGLDVAISGAPVAGDQFRVSAHKGSAAAISVTQSDPNKVAAASTAAGVPGDNANALLIAAIQNKAVTALGGNTLQGYYSGLTSDVGARAQTAQRHAEVELTIHAQLFDLRESVSGVSLDEEMTNIIRFQRAYEASARLITLADELYQTVLGMLR